MQLLYISGSLTIDLNASVLQTERDLAATGRRHQHPVLEERPAFFITQIMFT